MSWKRLTEALSPGQEIFVLTHENPDGDAMGSSLGFCVILDDAGYKPRFITKGAGREGAYDWLPGQEFIMMSKTLPDMAEAAAIIALDCADLSRCEYPVRGDQVLLNTDHHISNPEYGGIIWLDYGAGATAQVLCDMLYDAGLTPPPRAATCFYAALVSDTGGFRFSNANARTLRLASSLADSGADLDLVRRRMWENRPASELILLKEMMSSMTVFAEGAGVLCALSYPTLMEADIMFADTDAALEIIRSSEGVEAVALLKEIKPGKVKVSLRTKDYLDGAAFMAQVGGGGHVRAAGGTIEASFERAKEMILASLTEALSRSGYERSLS